MSKARILVVSDTHRQTFVFQTAKDYFTALKPDMCVHLGDMTSDASALRQLFPDRPLFILRGNCDWISEHPLENVIDVAGAEIFLCHGHTYDVKAGTSQLLRAAKNLGCSVALFGHTHQPLARTESGVLLLNPGALSAAEPSFALLTIENGKPEATHLHCYL